MFKCQYCGKESKSNAGKIAHERRCADRTDEARTVEVEIVGESNYYVGHPRRLIKLQGLLSRTFDKSEWNKIHQMITELKNAN